MSDDAEEPLAPLYDPSAWCTDEIVSRRPGETQEQWTRRLLQTAQEHGDDDFVRRFEQAVAAHLLGYGRPVSEA